MLLSRFLLRSYVEGAKILGGTFSSVDIWILDLRLLIFIDGRTHFEDSYNVSMEEQQTNDRKANERAKELGFHVLRLCFSDEDDFHDIIQDAIDEIVEILDFKSGALLFKVSPGFEKHCEEPGPQASAKSTMLMPGSLIAICLVCISIAAALLMFGSLSLVL